jgi:hypothetical protein
LRVRDVQAVVASDVFIACEQSRQSTVTSAHTAADNVAKVSGPKLFVAGSPRVCWQTHRTNLAAMQLYDKMAERSGFVG